MPQGNREVFLKSECTFNKIEWIDDLDQIPLPFKQAEQTISSWLNRDQKWHSELFGKSPSGYFPNFYFVYKGENPPLNYSPSFLGLRKNPHLDLCSILSSDKIPFPADFGTTDSIGRKLYFSTVDIGQFTYLLENAPQTPYTVDHVFLLPYLKRSKDNSKITGEDPNKLVVNVQLEDQLHLIPEKIAEKESEADELREEIKKLHTYNQALKRFKDQPSLF